MRVGGGPLGYARGPGFSHVIMASAPLGRRGRYMSETEDRARSLENPSRQQPQRGEISLARRGVLAKEPQRGGTT